MLRIIRCWSGYPTGVHRLTYTSSLDLLLIAGGYYQGNIKQNVYIHTIEATFSGGVNRAGYPKRITPFREQDVTEPDCLSKGIINIMCSATEAY